MIEGLIEVDTISFKKILGPEKFNRLVGMMERNMAEYGVEGIENYWEYEEEGGEDADAWRSV